MKTALKVLLLLGLMVFALLAAPAIVSHLCGGFLSGIAGLAVFGLLAVLFVGLAVLGGGTAVIVGLALLLALGGIALAVLLPITLPLLLLVGLIVLPFKLARRLSRPATA